MVSPKNGSSRVACTIASPESIWKCTALSCPFGPLELRDLPSRKLILPSITSSFIRLTEAGAALNASRRCTSVRLRAIGCRFSVQSSALSPPPTITTSWSRKSSIRRTA